MTNVCISRGDSGKPLGHDDAAELRPGSANGRARAGFRRAGALNLFGFKPNAFGAEDETIGVVLAAHAAAAILASRQGEQLESALSTRDRIGQAKGIIMERFGVDDVRAFEMLRRLSQDSNTRLVDIAQRVIDTRVD
jgi:ANTAR domain